MTKTVLEPVLIPEVANAVNFLNDVSQKGFKEVDLKKYLMNSRGLKSDQVDKAFQIHRSRLQGKAKLLQGNRRDSAPMPQKKENGTTPVEGALRNKSGDRPEMASKTSDNKTKTKSPQSSLFLPENKAEGDKLVKDFLRDERTYWSKLQCLNEDYYKELTQMAQGRRFRMTRKEIDEIFFRVPQLCEFHKAFYNDIRCEFNIGRIFVRLFNFFKRYVAYMKDCTATINKMREYTRDADLHSCLDRVRERSMFKHEDMMDLLLIPLKRIAEYSEFLDKLYKLADVSKEAEYEYLGKASRRIGRVAAYINKYMDGIWNRNEMNKIQQFLGSQCDIIAPYRKIVRRGMMIRRTSGFTARNKHYIFFLFNDIFLWTSIRGHLHNLIHLHNCEVLPSDAKLDSERKFRIISRGERFKSLLLECESVKQRDEWYVAVESKIADAKKTSAEVWSKNEFTSNIETKNSEEEEEEKTSGRSKIKTEPNSNMVSQSNKRKEPSEKESKMKEAVKTPNAQQPVSSYLLRYQLPHNFKEQELQNFEPVEDSISVISEPDSSFNDLSIKDEEAFSTTTLMSPFRKQNPSGLWGEGTKQEMKVPQSSKRLISGSTQRNCSSEFKSEESSTKNSGIDSNSRTSKIQRGDLPVTPTLVLKKNSSFTIQLNHLNGT